MKLRLKAIWCALYFGILPWQWYEQEKHYKCTYLQHLLLNLGYALKWIFFFETESDIEFEKRINNK